MGCGCTSGLNRVNITIIWLRCCLRWLLICDQFNANLSWMVQKTPCFGRSVSFSPRCTVCPGTNWNLNFWKRRAMRMVALSEEKTLPMQTLGPQEKGKNTKFEMLFLSLAENLSGIKLSGLFQCWGEWWDTKMEKLIFVPLGIWNGPNISGFVVTRTVPEAGGCLRRLSLRVCPRYSSLMVSPYSTVCFDPKSLSTSENNLSKIREQTLMNTWPISCQPLQRRTMIWAWEWIKSFN